MRPTTNDQRRKRRSRWPSWQDLVRRGADIVISALLLVCIVPWLLLIAVWIKFDSPGAVFFRQVRVGKHGRPFQLIKLRSMFGNPASPGPEITADGDARITRVGRHLRHWKLDELPQLWNVLRGDMTLVGPRPEVPKWVDAWPTEAAELILGTRPGMTDPVTLQLRHEESLLATADDPEAYYREVLLEWKAEAYADYLRSRSLARDAMLLATTFWTILIERNSQSFTQLPLPSANSQTDS